MPLVCQLPEFPSFILVYAVVSALLKKHIVKSCVIVRGLIRFFLILHPTLLYRTNTSKLNTKFSK